MIVNGQMPSRFKPKFPVSLNRQSLQSWGLIACYSMIEGGGSTLFDISGNKLNATNVASPTWGVGPRGAALTYNGSTQDSTIVVNTAPANIPAPFKTIANANSYSFSAWIKTSSAAAIGSTAPWGVGNPVIEGRNTTSAANAHGWSFGTETGKLATSRINNTSSAAAPRISSATSVNDNKWHFVAATINVNAVSLYIDGKLDATSTFSDPAATGDCSLGGGVPNAFIQMGARTTSASAYTTFYNGQMDDVRVYNRMLQPTEVQQMYINPLGLFSVSPSPRYWYSTAVTPPPPPVAATSGQYLMLLGVGT